MSKPALIKDCIAEQLQNGDHRVYEQLFTAWYEPLCRYACAILRDMDEAEETVQKVFYKLWDARERLEIRTSVKSYLYRMVHNACLNRIQQLKTTAEHHRQYGHMVPVAENSTAAGIAHGELEEKIRLAIDALPPQCKKIFEMSRFQHMSYAEIAAELRLSTNTIENHIAKALKSLRVRLKEFLPLLLFLIN
jgi:RNA polymerase sigma-70 factor (ECF subfamily)